MASTLLQDYDDIRSTVQLYIDSCASGNSEIMKPAFHQNATINAAPIQTLFDSVDKAGKTPSSAVIDILDIVNDIAVVRVTLKNYFGVDYIDFHSLKKDENGWKIIAKIFTEIK